MTDNNQWRKVGAVHSAELVARVRRLTALGRSTRQVGETVGLNLGAVHRLMKTHGITPAYESNGRVASVREPVGSAGTVRHLARTHRVTGSGAVSALPAPEAMVRLAQYDPVVARALRVRLGLDAESVDL